MSTRPRLSGAPRPLRYLLVGAATLLVYVATSFGLASGLGAPASAAAGVAVLASGTFNLIAHARVTFPGSRPDLAAACRYALLLGTNALAAAAIVALARGWGADLGAANMLALAAVTASSYFALKLWVLPQPPGVSDPG